jgi:uncharacterized protein
MNIKALIQRYPVASYFVLAYVISWGGCLAIAGPKFLRSETLQFTDALPMFFSMLAGPSIAGITMTYIADGKSGLQYLFSRMSTWQVGVCWYAVALLLPPVLILTVLLTLTALVSPGFSPGFLLLGFVIGLLTGFFEEIGWMGYAFPKMELKHSAFATSIYLGLLWTVWHVVADYFGSSGALGVYWLPHFLVWMIVTMTAMRVLIVWVYVNTRSVLLAQLMHVSSTGFLGILVPSLSPGNDLFFYSVYAAVLWIVVVIVVARYGKALMRQPLSAEAS